MRGVSTPAADRGAAAGDTADGVEAVGHFPIYIYLGAAAGSGRPTPCSTRAVGARSGAPTS
jgi:hypothetical protein